MSTLLPVTNFARRNCDPRRHDLSFMAKYAAIIRKKAMARGFRNYRSSSSAALLRSSVLTFAFLAQASPARSEVIDLTCVGTDTDITFRTLIDTDRSSVMEVWPNGSYKYAATISDQFIKYSHLAPNSSHNSYNATIDRIAGTLSRSTIFEGRTTSAGNFVCRRATKKF